MVDSIDFINDHVSIYCGHDIYSYDIDDLYIVRYIGFTNDDFSLIYVLYVKDKEDKFILPDNLLKIFNRIGVKIL